MIYRVIQAPLTRGPSPRSCLCLQVPQFEAAEFSSPILENALFLETIILANDYKASEQEKRGGTYIDPQHTQACRKDESQTHKWINRLPYGTTERAYDSPRVHCSIQDAGLVGGDQQ